MTESMQQISRKALSLFLAVSMLCGMVQGARVFAFAAGSTDVTAYYCDSGLFKDPAFTDGPVGTDAQEDLTFRESVTKIEFKDSTTDVGEKAFYDCEKLTDIAVPDSVTFIGGQAFAFCYRLTDAAIPAGVTKIGNGAFAYCDGLAEITVAEGNANYCSVDGVLFTKDRSQLLFYPARKTDYSYSIPGTVTQIGENAFADCSMLSSVTIPSSVIEIGDEAFCNCSLSYISIPNSVTEIGNRVFSYCDNLVEITVAAGNENYCSSDGVLFTKDKTKLLLYPAEKAGLSYLIPDTVTAIGEDAFCGCYNLTSITIPAVITAIGKETFIDCSNLKSATFAKGSKLVFIGEDAFSYSGLNSVDIPAGVTEIGDYAFSGCDSLENVTFEEGSKLTSIGEEAFSYTGLTEIVIPTGAAKISDSAFYSCTYLTDALFESETPPTTIGSGVFDDCAGSFTIWVPDETAVDHFKNIRSLSGYTISTAETIGNDETFTSGGLEYQVMSADLKTAEVIGYDADVFGNDDVAISIPGKVLDKGNTLQVAAISGDTFRGYSVLRNISIPSGVTEIGPDAFAGCFDMKKIEVDAGNSTYCSVDGVLFTKDKTKLVAYPGGKDDFYEVPDTVTEIGEGAFECSNLGGIILPGNVEVIGENAFHGSCISDVFLPSGVKSIGNGAFSSCVNLTDATFESETPPENVGTDVFNGDGEDFTIWVPDGSVVSGYQTAFSDCQIESPQAFDTDTEFSCGGIVYKITSADLENVAITSAGDCNGDLSIPEKAAYKGNIFSVTAVDKDAFYRNGLTDVTVPARITSIGDRAFYECESLAAVTFEKASILTSIGDKAFDYTDLLSITLPAGVTTIGESAFAECYQLTAITVDPGNSTYCSVGGVLLTKDKTALIQYPIGNENASYTVPKTVTSISDNAFEDCKSLIGIILPASLTSIGNQAFESCEKLTGVVLPDNVQKIGEETFCDCNLTAVIIPSSVTEIGEVTFSENKDLTDVTFVSKVPPSTVGSDAFERCAASLTIWVPDENAVTDYKNTSSFNGYSIKAAETVNIDAKFTYGGISYKVTSVEPKTAEVVSNSDSPYDGNLTISKKAAYQGNVFSVTAIGGGAFADCSELTGVTIPATVRSISSGAFTGSTALTEITVDESNGSYCGVDGVLLSKDKKTIVAYPTGKANTNYTVPSGVMAIGESAFAGGHSLTGITLPNSVASIGNKAFQGGSLTNAVLQGKVTLVGSNAFAEGEDTSITFAVPTGAVNYYRCLLNSEIMGKTMAVIIGTKIITAIADLPAAKNVGNGTILDALNFPTSLAVTADGAQETINVTWSSSPEYNSATAGSYVFTPAIPNGYVLGDGVNVKVKVTVAAKSNSNHSSAASSLSTAVTAASSNATADLSGAALPSSVTSVTLNLTPETPAGVPQGTARGTADLRGAAAYSLAVSDTALNVIGTPLLYSMSLLDQNGAVVNPVSGSVTVKLPVPSGLRGTPHVFLYDGNTGKLIDLGATVLNGALVFQTNSFGNYIIAGTGDSIVLDTTSYEMPINGSYQIGAKLTGSKAAAIKVYSTNDSIAAVTKLANGNYQVTGKNSGTVYIMYDVYDDKNNLLTHASVKVDVKAGVKPNGNSERQYGIF